MRILLVEDNRRLAGSICDVLSGSGYQMDWVDNIGDASAALAGTPFALILLDLTLTDGDGFSLLKELRQKRIDTPVLILTARDALETRVQGLDLGADDYMTKPFDVAELEARIRALIRRSAGQSRSEVDYAGLTLDLTANSVTAGEERLDISPREFAVLRLMVLSKSDVVPKSQIGDALSSFDVAISDNAVEQIMSRLRKRLAPHAIKVQTARGIGYYLLSDEADG